MYFFIAPSLYPYHAVGSGSEVLCYVRRSIAIHCYVAKLMKHYVCVHSAFETGPNRKIRIGSARKRDEMLTPARVIFAPDCTPVDKMNSSCFDISFFFLLV